MTINVVYIEGNKAHSQSSGWLESRPTTKLEKQTLTQTAHPDSNELVWSGRSSPYNSFESFTYVYPLTLNENRIPAHYYFFEQ